MEYFKNFVRNLLKRVGYILSPISTSSINIVTTEPPEFKDQKSLIGNSTVTIFDVGAHIGEISIEYNNLFNEATIYAFEPFPESFEILKGSVNNYPNIKIFNKALGNSSGKVSFHVNKSSATNSILATHQDSGTTWAENLLDTIDTIKIDTTTVDEFVEKNSIERIDILKLDTQGTEYEIIEGAAKTIDQNKIKIIYLEIIIRPTYQKQHYFDEILLLLRSRGFRLYNLYNFSHTQRGELRQVDAIFVHISFDETVTP